MSTDAFVGSELASKTIIESLLSFKAPKTKQTWQTMPPPPDLTCTKQPTLQALRVLGLIEDAKRKVGIAVMVEHIIDNLDRYAVSLGMELSQLLQQHNRLLIRYHGEAKKVNDLMASNEASMIAAERQELLEASRLSALKTISFLDEFENFGLGEDEEEDEEEDHEEVIFATTSGEKVSEFPSSSTITCRLPATSKDFCLTTRSGGSLAVKSSGYLGVNDAKKSSASAVETPETSEEDYNQSARFTISGQLEPAIPGIRVPEQAPGCVVAKESKLGKSANFPSMPEFKEAMQREALFQKAVRSMCSIVGEVADSFRVIIRKFTNDPSAIDIVHRSILANTKEAELLDLMNGLHESASFRVLTTPEQHQERLLYMEDVGKRNKVNRKILGTLSRELNSVANYQEDREFIEKLELLRQLQLDTHQIQKFSDEAIRRNYAEAQKMKITEERHLDEKAAQVGRDIEELKGFVNNSITRNREIETELRNEKYKMEQELEAFIKNYDEIMISKMETYETLEMNHKDEKILLEGLEEYFADLEKEYMTIMEERRSARMTVTIMRRTFRATSVAIKLIQGVYRAYVVRKAIAAEEKKRARLAKKSKTGKKGDKPGKEGDKPGREGDQPVNEGD